MSVEQVKKQIENLYKKNPDIHISISISRPRVVLENAPAVITGVYPNFFRIEEKNSGFLRSHTVRYADLATNALRITELKCE